MMRIPSNNPIRIRGDPSGLESIQLEEIIVLEKPRVPLPLIRSLGTSPTQPEVSRKPCETGVPNTLFYIITIYDDEEISEVSLVTMVLITEEKELEKAYAPSLNAPVQKNL
jgi:hypothetical protein